MISSTLFFITAFASIAQIPTVTAGPACVQRHKNQADCIAECAARWGWPGAVMGTDPWGNVISPSDAQSMSDVIASACGAVESQSPDGALSGQSSSVVASFSNLAAALPSSATTLIVSSSVTTSTLTSLSATTPSSSSSKLSSTRSISSSLSSSSTSLSTRPTVSSSSSASSTRTSSSSLTTVRTTTPQTTAKTTSSSSNGSSSSTGGSSGSSSGSTPGSSSGSTGGTSNSDIQAYLSAHNTVRAQHGASPLTWNNTLANAAQKWANGCVFQHSGGSLGPFGENLAAGTGSSYGIAQAVGSWTNEVSQYDPNNPQPSHFTQVVWKATSQVGCALQECSGIFPASYGLAKYYVCEYFAQGNVIGQFPQNVQV